jgi:N-acyl-D-amino-acid deacylase
MPDTIFKDVLIVDGSGAEPFVGDLRVSGERITEIGKVSSSPEDMVIRFQNFALCPGFVDAHGHSDYQILVVPSAESKILQGMTTEVCGNCGYSGAPVFGEMAKERKKGLKDEYGLEKDFKTFKKFFQHLQDPGIAVNLAPQVGYNTVRACVTGYRREPPDKEEMRKVQSEISKAMALGCFGMSAGLIYAPGTFATKEELIEALAPVREAGGLFSCHIRSEGDKLIEAVTEFIEIGRQARVRLQLSHLKTSGRQNWKKLDQVFDLVEDARQEGIDIKADRYPYTASFTSLSSVLPDWVFEDSGSAYQDRLKTDRERIKKELEAKPVDSWKRIVVSQCFSERAGQVEGKSIAELAQLERKPPVDFFIDFLTEEKASPNAIFHSMSSENMERIYLKDWVMVGTDSGVRGFEGILAKGKPHPRAFGAFPRFINQMVKIKKLLSLAKAVEKSSRVCAEHFRIKDRGKIAVGYYADLVLFDPEVIRDHASFENPFLAPRGIEIVMVNGQVAAMQGEVTGRLPGKVLEMGK